MKLCDEIVVVVQSKPMNEMALRMPPSKIQAIECKTDIGLSDCTNQSAND